VAKGKPITEKTLISAVAIIAIALVISVYILRERIGVETFYKTIGESDVYVNKANWYISSCDSTCPESLIQVEVYTKAIEKKYVFYSCRMLVDDVQDYDENYPSTQTREIFGEGLEPFYSYKEYSTCEDLDIEVCCRLKVNDVDVSNEFCDSYILEKMCSAPEEEQPTPTVLPGILRVSDAYCIESTTDIASIHLINNGTRTIDIDEMEVTQTSPSGSTASPAWNKVSFRTDEIATFTDVCEGQTDRTCSYKITPPEGKTLVVDVSCEGTSS